MFEQTNDSPFGPFLAASHRYADAAVRINRLAMDHAGQVLGLQVAAFEQNARAAFAFLGEVAGARDAGQLQAAWPRGLQVARDNVGRAMAAGQESLVRGLKTQEAIAELARGSFEAAGTPSGAAPEAARKRTKAR